MSDLIDRQAAIDALKNQMSDRNDLYNIPVRRSIVILEQLPSAQPEQKRGHWVEIGDEPYDEWECDVCGFVIDGSGCIDPEEYRDVYNFCPNCGAYMRGETDGR